MRNYILKEQSISAQQWFKNGDHALDYKDRPEAKEHKWEGSVVRYWRDPFIEGSSVCEACGEVMDKHGWIDKAPTGRTVCPGDFIVELGERDYYPMKTEVFKLLFKLPV